PRPAVLSPIAAEGDRPGTEFLVQLESIQEPFPPPQVTVSSATTRLQTCVPTIEQTITAATKLCFITPPLTLEEKFEPRLKFHTPTAERAALLRAPVQSARNVTPYDR